AVEPLDRNRAPLGAGREHPVDLTGRRHAVKSSFLLGSPFKLAQPAQPWCIAVPGGEPPMENASSERPGANCGNEPRPPQTPIMAAEGAFRRDVNRRDESPGPAVLRARAV